LVSVAAGCPAGGQGLLNSGRGARAPQYGQLAGEEFMFNTGCLEFACGDEFGFVFCVRPPFAVQLTGSDADEPQELAGGASAEDVVDVADGKKDHGPVTPDHDELAEVKARLIAEARKYRRRAQEAERRLADIEPQVLSDPDRRLFDRLKAEANELGHVRQSHRRQIAELTQAHGEELVAANAQAQQLTSMLSAVVGTDRLKTALAAKGVKQVDQAARLLARRVKVEITSGGYSVQVVDESGQPVSAGDGEGTISVEELVETWLADNSHFLPPSGDTGSGAHPGLSAGCGISIEQLDRNPARKAEFVARYGPGALVRLARGRRKPKGG